MMIRSRVLAFLFVIAGLVGAAAPAQAQQVTFDVGEATTVPGDTVQVDVTVSDFVDVTSAQFTLEWDPSVAAFDSTGAYGLPGLTAANVGTGAVEDGALTVSWDDPDADGATVSDSTVIFSLSLVATGEFDDSTAVAFADAPTAREVTVNFNTATFDGRPGRLALSAAPDAPANLTRTATPDTVSLSWDASTAGDLAGYNVYRSTAPFAAPSGATRLNTTPLAAPAYTDSTVAEKTTYYYRVTAVDTGGNEGPPSSESAVTPGLIYVDADATGADNGGVWGDAFTSLQDALAAAQTGEELWIAEGTYYPDEGANVFEGDREASFSLIDGVDLYGGFSGTEGTRASRNPADHPTVLSGDIDQDGSSRSLHVLRAGSSVSVQTRVAGVRIAQGGGYEPGGGLSLRGGVTLTGVVFLDNNVDEFSEAGGAIYGTGADTLRIEGSRFVRNSAEFGGGISFSGDFLSIANSLLLANQSTQDGGGVRVDSGGVSVVNSSFLRNDATDFSAEGAGLYNGSNQSVVVANSLFWPSVAGSDSTRLIENNGADLRVRYSLVEGAGGSGTGWNPQYGTDGGGNIDADPLFADTLGADGTPGTRDDNYGLLAGSPARDAGQASALPSDRLDLDRDGDRTEALPVDLEGEARVQDSTVDMGPLEGIEPPPAPTGLAATGGDGRITLSWTPPLDRGIAGYNIYRSTTAFSDTGSATRVNASPVQSPPFTDAGLSNDSSYTYRVAAVDAVSNVGTLSGGATARPTSRDTIYVDAGAIGTDDGTSWVDAYTSLQDALASATDSSEIWVAGGVYVPDRGSNVADGRADTSFVLRASVAIYGGFAGDERRRGARNPEANRTILSGDIDQDDGTTPAGLTRPGAIRGTNSHHVVRVAPSATAQARLDGVTVTGGDAPSTAPAGDGGGIYMEGGAPTLARLRVTGNRADAKGGGLYLTGPVVVSNTVIAGNQASNGGGAYLQQSTASMSNVVLRGNRASNNGGGLYLLNASPTLGSVTLSGNRAGTGGAMAIFETSGGGSSPTITNGVFWRNAAGSVPQISNGAELTLRAGIVAGGTAAIQGNGRLTSSDVVDADPLFVRNVRPADAPTLRGDLRLQEGSAALSAGDATLLPADRADLDADGDTTEAVPVALGGGARVQDDTLDLGAYEGAVGNPPPAAPSGLTATAQFGEVTVSWDSVLTSDFGRYRVYQQTDSTAAPSNLVYESPAGQRGATSYTPSLSADTTYYFNVTAVDDAGNESAFSGRASARPLAVDTIYVDADAGGQNDGTSWADAYTTLQDALQTASRGDRVWVADGVYYPDEAVNTSVSFDDSTETFVIPEQVDVYGGFAGGETQRSARDPQANRAILSGDITQNDADPDGDGIITHPDSINGSNTLSIVRANSNSRLDGVVVTAGSYTIDNDLNGVVETGGGGVVFNRLTIVGNEVIGSGCCSRLGILTSRHDRVRVARSLFVENVSNEYDYQGVLLAGFRDQLTVLNTVATGNEGTLLSDAFNEPVYTLSNVTVADHEGAFWTLGDSGSELTVRNSVFWDHSGRSPRSNGDIAVRHSLIQGSGGSGTDWDNSYGTDGGGNLDADPRFADPDGPDGIPGTLDDNLRVADTGPAYNAGDADLLPADSADLDRDGDVTEPLPVDYRGQSRVQNGGLTMGAYEAAADVPPLAPDTLRATVLPDSTTLRWPAGSERDVNAYNVYRDTAPFDSVGAATKITSSPVSDTVYVDAGVQAGTAYYYRVTAVDDAGQEGPGSPQVRTPEDRTPPDAPASLTATAYAGSASLTWSASDSTDTNVYRVYRDTAPLDASEGPRAYPVLDTVAAGDTTYTDGGLSRGVTYHYRVTAVDDSSNESGFSPGATATPGTDLRVSQVRPASGAPGTPVRVYGAGFDSTAADHTVTFDATQVPVDSVGPSVLYTRVPRGLRGPVPVSVQRASDGQSASPAGSFTVVSGGDTSFVDSSVPLAGVESSASDWGDYDGDGDLDLVLAGDTTGSGDFATTIYRNDGGGSFTAVNAGLPGFENGDVAWGDYDDDGDLDLVVTGGAGAKAPVTKLYRNEGQGRFVAVGAGLRGVSESAAAWGDADGDGDLDLVVTGAEGGTRVATLYRNEGGGTFVEAKQSLVGVDNGALAWGDYNRDGRLDLAVTGDTSDFTGPATVIYRNEGNARFTPLDADVAGARTGSVAWGDYNADGKLDLLVAGDSTGSSTPATTIYRNEGGGQFAEAGATLGGISDGAAAWGDYDGDGRLDVAVVGDSSGSAAASAALYRNAGGGAFARVPSGLAGVQSGTVAWGDYDGNGTLDLIISGDDGTGPVTTLYRNKSGDLVPPDPPSSLTANATPDSISLAWRASDSSDVASYALYRATAPIDSVAGPGSVSVLDSTAVGDTTYTDTTVALGTTYYYRVAAIDAAGNESAFSPEAAATPRNRLYVDASNTPSGCATAASVRDLDGASWACAFPALQDAFDLANKNARNAYEIWVAAGTYYPDVDTVANDGVRDDSLGSDHRPDAATEHFTLTRDSVSVYGGFSGGESARSDRDPTANVVTLSGDIDQNDDAFAPNTDSDGVDSTFAQTDHHKGDNAHHVLLLDGRGEGTISSSTVLDGLTVRAGRADAGGNPGDIGGGLLCRAPGAGNTCSPTLRNVRFVGNYARAGGAVFNEADSSGASSPTLVDVRFEGNAAGAAGGGVFNEAGGSGTASPTLTRPVFVNNTTGRLGGAMYNDGGDGAGAATSSPTLTEAQFQENTAGYRGGALYNDAFGGAARPTITKGTFTKNSAPVDSTSFPSPAGGGAIANGAVAGGTASPRIDGATFADNRAVSAQAVAGGGALYTFSDSTDAGGNRSTAQLSVVNSSFSGNTASNGGGAVYSVTIRGGVMASDVRGASFSQNVADRGGAVRLEGLRPSADGRRSLDTTRIENTSFSRNRGRDRGGAVFIEGRRGGEARQALTGVTFTENEAGAGGGALEVLGTGTSADGTAGRAAPRITGVRLRQNRATSGAGGALVNRSTDGGTAVPTIANGVFAGNVASGDGGAVDNRSQGGGTASPTFVNVTLAGNAADESGGAVATRRNAGGAASPTFANAILWDNAADADGDGSGSGRSFFVLDGGPEARYSIVEGGCPAPVACSGNLLNQAPQFAGKQDGAGPDSTFGTIDDDLRVQGPGSQGGASPAIDAGDNAALDLDGDGAIDVASALGGRTRRLEVPGVTDTGAGTAPIVDMGAYESTGAPLSTLQAPLALRTQATPDSVTLRWTSPAAYAPDRYRIYRDTGAIGTAKRPSNYVPVDSTGGGTTTFVDPSVAADSTYYYRVTAVDTAGIESQFSNQAVAVTEAPLVAQSATVQSDGAVDLGNTGVNLSFTGVSGSGTVEVRKFGSGPAGAPGIAESTVSKYRYVISASPSLQFDSTDVRLDVGTLSGVSDPSNVTVYTRSVPAAGSFVPLPTTYDSASNRLVVTTGSFSEFVLASDTETLTPGGGDALRIPSLAARGTPSGPEVTLSWTAPSATDVRGYRVYRATTSFSDTTNATQLNAGGLLTANQFADADVQRGTTYFYRVVAVESSGFSGPVSKAVQVTLPAAEFSASVGRQFGAVTDPQNYRLVSLPGAGSRSVSAVVAGEPGAQNQFRAFREEGGAEQGASDLAECGVDVSGCSFTPGTGFWLLARDDWSTSNTFEAVSLSERGTFTTSLTAGWNLISNPFAEPLAWQEVQAANEGALPPEVWTRSGGGWERVTELASASSGRAYYINVPANRPQLVLPHPTATDSVSAASGSTTQRPRRTRLARVRDSARTVSLRALVEGEERSSVRLGVSDAARTGLDALDLAAPPFPVPTVSLRAVPDTGASSALLRAYRPLDGAGQRFPLRLRTGGENMVTLRPGRMDLGAKYDVVLVKADIGQSYDLREDEKVVLQPDEPSTRLVLLVGTPSYIEDQKSRLAPDELRLLGNYPNPVAHSTTIEYGLPEEEHVRLELYDILGRRIQVLVNETQRAGFHRVQWGGADRSVASGVYFYRLRVGDKSKVKKMTVVR